MDKWKTLEEKLFGYFGRADIVADGYEITFVKRLDKSEKLVIETYVDGEIRGEWMNADKEQPTHPQAQFFAPRKAAAWKRKDYKSLKLVYGKKKADDMVTPKVIMFSPIWTSSRTLIAHLKRNFPDLEIVNERQAQKSA